MKNHKKYLGTLYKETDTNMHTSREVNASTVILVKVLKVCIF